MTTFTKITLLLIIPILILCTSNNDNNYNKYYGENYPIKLSLSKIDDEKVKITYKIPSSIKPISITLFRSYLNLNLLDCIDLMNYPITFKKISGEEIIDSIFANGTTYYYYLIVETDKEKKLPSNIDSIYINQKIVNTNLLTGFILIDKENYVLEIWHNNKKIKSYPICLGKNPIKRKLFKDNKTTPEGEYKIAHINLNSKFYKSLILDYPNQIDKQRYYIALQKDSIPKENGVPLTIGESIAIHGGDIENNWTWGCIAMRNNDIDELLSFRFINKNTKVIIVGSEVKRKHLLP